MCGICGYLHLNLEAPASLETVRPMNDALRHRGPDDEGYHVEGPVALGHRRLSIIDLSEHGRQPIYNEDRSVCVVLNGEIYNFPELKEDLVKRGHVFASRTDTEVLVHAYEEWGDDFIPRVHGMFAFVLWDAKRRRLVGARDRMGKKPFYHCVFDGQFIFASELKGLLRHPAVKREIDLVSLDKYLTFDYVPAPHSIFKDVHKVEPGCAIVVEKGGVRTYPYWTLRVGTEKNPPSPAEAAERLRGLLLEAVRKRLMSDVPLGVFLSGGLDSSTVTALMAEAGCSKIETFSIGFEEASFDESEHARRVAEYVGAEHHAETLSAARMRELTPEVASILDEPLGDYSILPTYLLSRFTRSRVTVALGGDGGDELFAGYPTYQAHKIFPVYRALPGPLRRRVVEPLVRRMPTSYEDISLDFKAKRFIRGAECDPRVRNHFWIGSFTPEEKRALYSPATAEAVDGSRCFEEALAIWGACPSERHLDRVLTCDARMYLQDDILVKVDRASMAVSLEVRAPLLDTDVVEFAASLPLEYKLHRFNTKHILKEAMKGSLPEGIAGRKKKGFGIPFAEWIRGELKGFIRDVFAPEKIRREGLFRPEAIQTLLGEHFDGRANHRKNLFTLMVFELWREKYLDG